MSRSLLLYVNVTGQKLCFVFQDAFELVVWALPLTLERNPGRTSDFYGPS